MCLMMKDIFLRRWNKYGPSLRLLIKQCGSHLNGLKSVVIKFIEPMALLEQIILIWGLNQLI